MEENNVKGDTFVFFPTFVPQLRAIRNKEMELRMRYAIEDYGIEGTLPDFSDIDPHGIMDGMFEQFKYLIDSSKAKRKKRSQINKTNGEQGGAQEGNQNARKYENSSENNQNEQKRAKTSKTSLNVNVNVNGNGTHKFNKLNCVCEEKHTLTQEEKKDLESRREVAKQRLDEARKSYSQNPRGYEQAKYELESIEAKLDAGMTYDKFTTFIKTKCRSLAKRMDCITLEEYAYWLQTADRYWLAETCEKMNGRKDVKEKFDSLHSALKSWWGKDYANPHNQ